MSDLSNTIQESVESKGISSLNTIVALLVSLSATFLAICNVKDGNIVQGMQQAQANAVDAWSYYQAKSTKLHFAEGMVDQITIERDTLPGLTDQARARLDQKIVEYTEQTKQFERDKEKIKESAEGFQKEYDRLNFRDDQFDMSEASLSVALAVFGVTALTQKRWLLAVAVAFTVFGTLLGVSGFLGYNFHPSFLAKLLT
jgi:hypothetical protein